MFSFDESNSWYNEAEHSHIKDTQWEHDPLSLQPLSDQPFDILNVITTTTQQQTEEPLESVANSVISSQDQLTDLDFEEHEQDIWTSHEPSTTTLNTLSWDTHNIHFPSFAQTQLAEKRINTPFITEAPIQVFEPIIHSRNLGQQPVYEADLVKSLIQVLVGSPSIYFYWHTTNGFQMRRATMRLLGLSGATLQPMIKELLQFATLLKKLETAATHCKETTKHYGLTGVAMGCCLTEFHLFIQQQIISLFENEQHEVTILKIHQYLNNLIDVTEKLCKLCCIGVDLNELNIEQREHVKEFGYYLPVGVDLINLLHTEIQYYDLVQFGSESFYRDLCLAMLHYISIPFLSMLSKWLGLESEYSGVFDDPYDEFFIKTNANKDNVLDRFDIRTSAKLPYFISRDLSIYIYRSGLSLQLLKKSTPNHPIFDLKETIPLKLLLSNVNSDSYASTIEDVCRDIQAYNTGTVEIPVIDEDMDESLDTDEENDILMQDDDDMPFKLTFLDTTSLNLMKGEFLLTLTKIIGHQQEPTNFIPTIDTITNQSYLQPLQMWCPILNQSFMSSFLHQFKLQYHLSLLYDHYLLASPNFIIGLENTFFNESSTSLSHTNRWPPRATDLNIALLDMLIENNDDQVFTFTLRESKETSVWLNPNGVEALDFLQLNYHATYPLNIVITKPIIHKYNRIFTFVLQLLRVHIVTKRMYRPIKEMKWFRASNRDRISRYRWILEQFISSIQGYVHHTAIQNTWNQFMQHVQDMQTPSSNDYLSVIMEPHTFKEYHQHILNRILYQCFLKRNQLQVLRELYHVLNDIIIFGKVLDDYEKTDVMAEDKLFLKCRKLFEQFQLHSTIFIKILGSIEQKGYGRLGSLLNNSSQDSLFHNLYTRHEAKSELDLFVKDLILRLNMNGFYDNKEST